MDSVFLHALLTRSLVRENVGNPVDRDWAGTQQIGQEHAGPGEHDAPSRF